MSRDVKNKMEFVLVNGKRSFPGRGGEVQNERDTERDRERAPDMAVAGGTPSKEKGGEGQQSAGQ